MARSCSRRARAVCRPAAADLVIRMMSRCACCATAINNARFGPFDIMRHPNTKLAPIPLNLHPPRSAPPAVGPATRAKRARPGREAVSQAPPGRRKSMAAPPSVTPHVCREQLRGGRSGAAA